MLLRNKLPHMCGASVLVNGAVYKLNDLGVADIKKEEDARKLLANSAWSPFTPRSPEEAVIPEVASKEVDSPASENDGKVRKEPENDAEIIPTIAMKKDELLAIAEARGFELGANLTKAEMVEILLQDETGQE